MKLALIGDPVAHSRSPELQREFLERAGLAGTYEAFRVLSGHGAEAIERLRDAGYLGLNVTTPLKEEAFARAERHDAVALASGSVNTLLLGEMIAGYNTDGAGSIGVLADAGLGAFASARVLVLGAGPTARSAIVALRDLGTRVVLWNRTAERAKAVALALGVRTFEADDSVDAVFSTLPPHARPSDADVVRAALGAPIFVDANYGDRATLAQTIGRNGLDGSAMLRHSARASFDIWRRASLEASR